MSSSAPKTIGLSSLAIVFIILTYSAIAQDQKQDVNKLEWWKKTNFYHIYIRSFKDSDGDGNGDLRGVIQKLDYLKTIGAETILMAPFYSSPMKDGGYDISDYRDIYPMFGTMADFEALVDEVRKRGMKMLVDFVPNHSSDKHHWFNCSEYAYEDPDRCYKYRDYYVWTNSTRYEGKYPSNWISVFGGTPAWTWSPVRKQFYLHQFLPEQPDLNFRNPEVREEFKEIARFWLRKGIDGLRVDSAIFLIEDADFTDEPDDPNWREGMDPADRLLHIHTRSLPDSAPIIKDWQDVVNEPEFRKPGESEKIIITEAYDAIPKLIDYYGPNPETPYANMPFNFELIKLKERKMDPQTVEQSVLSWINASMALHWPDEHGAMSPWICWVTGNHDNPRITSRVGYHNAAAFRWISYLAPGVPVNYFGDEMGLIDVPFNDIPQATINEGESSRLPERAPMAWDGSEPSGGFSSSANIWLPLERDYKHKNVANFLARNENNFLKQFLKLQAIRRDNLSLFSFGDLVFFRNKPSPGSSIFAMARTHETFGNLLLLVNFDFDYSCDAAQGGSESRKTRVSLEANESVLKSVRIEPPKRGTIVLTNVEPGQKSTLKELAEVDLENLSLDQAEAVLIKY